MRSLKECYEIAKQHHKYWSGKGEHTHYMCHAATDALICGELTQEEHFALTEDAMSLVESLDKSEISLKGALGNTSHEEVKAFWDNYINNMKNQDG